MNLAQHGATAVIIFAMPSSQRCQTVEPLTFLRTTISLSITQRPLRITSSSAPTFVAGVARFRAQTITELWPFRLRTVEAAVRQEPHRTKLRTVILWQWAWVLLIYSFNSQPMAY